MLIFIIHTYTYIHIYIYKKFTNIFSKLKDIPTKQKIIKQIKKISQNPNVGKPMKHDRKGTRELYISPFRLSYFYDSNKKIVYVLDIYHKKRQ